MRHATHLLLALIIVGLAAVAMASGAPDIVWSNKAHAEAVDGVAFTANGGTLASGSDVIRVWNAATGELKHTFDYPAVALALSPDNKTLATSSQEYDVDAQKVISVVRLWDLSTNLNTEALVGHNSGIYALAFSPSGAMMASGDDKYDTLLWDMAKLESIRVFPFFSNSVAFSPDGLWLAGGGETNWTRIWKVATGQMIAMGAYPIPNAVVFTPDNARLLVGGMTPPGVDGVPGVQAAGTIKVYRLSDRVVLANMRVTNDEITCLAMHPDGQQVIAGTKNRKIDVFSLQTYEITKEYDQETGLGTGAEPGVRCIAISPDGKKFAYGRDDGKVVVAWWPGSTPAEGEGESTEGEGEGTGEGEGEGGFDFTSLLACLQPTTPATKDTTALAGDGLLLTALTAALLYGARRRK